MGLGDLRVGRLSLADGSTGPGTLDRSGAKRVANVGGKYADSVLARRVFGASTALTGTSIVGAAAMSTTPFFALWNPNGSGKHLSILRVGFGYVSGTNVAGAFVYGASEQSAIPTGTAITISPMFADGNAGSVARAFTEATITAAADVLAIGVGTLAAIATTAVENHNLNDNVDGLIVIPPGNVFVVESISGASTTVYFVSVVYEEIDA